MISCPVTDEQPVPVGFAFENDWHSDFCNCFEDCTTCKLKNILYLGEIVMKMSFFCEVFIAHFAIAVSCVP